MLIWSDKIVIFIIYNDFALLLYEQTCQAKQWKWIRLVGNDILLFRAPRLFVIAVRGNKAFRNNLSIKAKGVYVKSTTTKRNVYRKYHFGDRIFMDRKYQCGYISMNVNYTRSDNCIQQTQNRVQWTDSYEFSNLKLYIAWPVENC
jgi:hypothetical protein